MASNFALEFQSDSVRRYSADSMWFVGICFFLSGLTGLIYEVLWARMLGLVFGATTLAVSTVLAAFMGGLALGSAVAGRLGSRLRRPVRAYGVLEIGIALYAIAVPSLFGLIENLYAILWQHFHPSFFTFSLLRFLLSCGLLLIPTTLMGATLPVLSAALVRLADAAATSVTRLYTRNLAGAIFGSLIAGFVLLPSLGVRATLYIAALVNIIIGLVTIVVDWFAQEDFAKPRAVGGNQKNGVKELGNEGSMGEAKFWMVCAFVSGFVTFSTQVAWTRMLTMIIGSSTYAFSIVVALFLLGLAGGAHVIARQEEGEKLRHTLFKVEAATAVSLVLSLLVANRIPSILINTGLRLNISSWIGLLMLQILCVALLVSLPAFLMGTVMPLVLSRAASSPGDAAVSLVGRSYAVNTIGAIAGAFGAGFVLIPRISTRFTILFAAALCVALAGMAYQPEDEVKEKGQQRLIAAGVTACLIGLMFFFAPKMNSADLSVGAYDTLVRVLAKTREGLGADPVAGKGPETHSLLMYEEGPTSTVSVRKDWDNTSMAINGRTNASDREDMPTQVMLGQMALLVAPSLKQTLVVGYATGVTAGAMLQSPIESLECVELEPATINGSRFFEHVNHQPLNDPRMRLIIDDARTYLRVTKTRYDVIVSEPSHPWVPGVANLFTEEFFELGKDSLNRDGVFVQWLQIYQLSPESLRSVLGTYQKVFPHVMVFRVGGATKGKDLILLGSKTPLTLDKIRARLTDQRIKAELARVNINNEADVRAWYVCNEEQLAPALAGAVINTDDNMHIETTVPREAFRPSFESNAAWLERLAEDGRL
ncbi:MAG: fused MFS/spermidine synthase [bacterium]